MRGKHFPDRIEVYIKPQDVIFAPATAKVDGKLKVSGTAIGSLISWFAWLWMMKKHPKIIANKKQHSMELTWDGKNFVATFREQ